MNTNILDNYNVAFSIIYDNVLRRNLAQFKHYGNDDLSMYLSLLFEQGTINSHLEVILETIMKAGNNKPFDPREDGGPEFISLFIRNEMITLKRLGHPNIVEISTKDLKELILLWFTFLKKNRVEYNVW